MFDNPLVEHQTEVDQRICFPIFAFIRGIFLRTHAAAKQMEK